MCPNVLPDKHEVGNMCQPSNCDLSILWLQFYVVHQTHVRTLYSQGGACSIMYRQYNSAGCSICLLFFLPVSYSNFGCCMRYLFMHLMLNSTVSLCIFTLVMLCISTSLMHICNLNSQLLLPLYMY